MPLETSITATTTLMSGRLVIIIAHSILVPNTTHTPIFYRFDVCRRWVSFTFSSSTTKSACCVETAQNLHKFNLGRGRETVS
jgi:hypothetical protein